MGTWPAFWILGNNINEDPVTAGSIAGQCWPLSTAREIDIWEWVRNNNGATYDHIYTHSSRTVLNLRVGFTRFFSPTIRLHEGKFNPSQLGFSAATAALFEGASYLPRFGRLGSFTFGRLIFL